MYYHVRTKLNEISAKALIEDTSKTSVYLKNLIELEIVEREFSVSDGMKERANSSRGLYRLTDNFFAVDKALNHYIIGECKFKGRPFSYAEFMNVKAKYTPNKEDIKCYYYLFSESDFDALIKKEAKENDQIKLVTIKDILLLKQPK